MEVRYRTRRLERCYAEHKLAIRAFGAEVGRRYIERINLIKAAQSVEDLSRLPGLRYHALSGDRQRQYAVNLNGFYRLILTLHGSSLEIVQIEEVSKHYGD